MVAATARTAVAKLKDAVAVEKARVAREALEVIEVEGAVVREGRGSCRCHSAAGHVGGDRLGGRRADGATDPDVRVVPQACDTRVALARHDKLPEDDRSLEAERDQ